MVAYCNAIWRCRYFWLSLVKMDLRSRYRGSFLGMGWSLAHPIAMTLIFTAIFSKLFGSQPGDYALYVMVGMACWTFLLQCATLGCLCFSQAETYIRQHPAPAAIYPLRVSLGSLFHFVIAELLCVALVLVFLGRFNPLALLSLPLTFLLLLLFGWCIATLFGLMHVHFRDTKHLTEILFQVLFYLTPVMYMTDMFPADSLLMRWMHFNPFLPFIDLLRAPIYIGRLPTPLEYTKACLIVVMAGLVTAMALRRLERRLIFHL